MVENASGVSDAPKVELDAAEGAVPVWNPFEASSSDSVEERFQKLEAQIKRLRHRDAELRNKIMAVQHAVVQEMGLTACELGHPAADIFPVEIRRAPDAPVRIFAFGSMGANSGLPPKQFFKAFQGKHCEIFFFKDFRQCWYQQGLLGLSHDVPSTLDYLKSLVADDPRPVSMVGASSGGFAAILFGALLGAAKIVAFSPQTAVTTRAFGRFATEDSVKGEIEFDSLYTDLRAVLEANPLRGIADIFFGRRAGFDAIEARRLEGVPGVNLRPIEWNGHNTAIMLRNLGQLDAVIDDLVKP